MARIVSLTVLTTLILIVGAAFFRVVAPFVLPLFLAAVVAILFRPLYLWLIVKTKQRVRLAAGLTTLAALATITLPLIVGTLLGVYELYVLGAALSEKDWPAVAANLQAKLSNSDVWLQLRGWFPDLPDAEGLRMNLGKLAGVLVERTLGYAPLAIDRTLGFVAGAIALAIATLTFVMALYYFLVDGPALIAASEQLIPVDVGYQRQLRDRFEQVVRAVVMSTFLAAIAQGLLTAVALSIAGIPRFFLSLVVSTLAALIPLAGTWLVWAPCAAWLAWNGHWVTAILLTVHGAVVVGLADNAIRTWVLNTDARLHPLLAFVSVLGGLQAVGLWGMFLGPIVATCLHALAQILNIELKALSKDATGRIDPAPTPPETTPNIPCEPKP